MITIPAKNRQEINALLDELARCIDAIYEMDVVMMKEERKENAHITDHAIVRWLERVEGLDVDDLKKQMLRASDIPFIQMGAQKIKRTAINGVRANLIIKDKTIVTVI